MLCCNFLPPFRSLTFYLLPMPCLDQLSTRLSCCLCHIPPSLYRVESCFLGFMVFIHSTVLRLALIHVINCILHFPRRSCPVGDGSQTPSTILCVPTRGSKVAVRSVRRNDYSNGAAAPVGHIIINQDPVVGQSVRPFRWGINVRIRWCYTTTR